MAPMVAGTPDASPVGGGRRRWVDRPDVGRASITILRPSGEAGHRPHADGSAGCRWRWSRRGVGVVGYVVARGMDVLRRVLHDRRDPHDGRVPGDPVRSTPPGKVFTIVLLLMGAGLALMVIIVGAQALAEGRRRPTSQEETHATTRSIGCEHHTIICAYGRVGRAVANALQRAGTPFVVIELAEEQRRSHGERRRRVPVDDPSSKGCCVLRASSGPVRSSARWTRTLRMSTSR